MIRKTLLLLCAALLLILAVDQEVFATWHISPAGGAYVSAFVADTAGQRMVMSVAGAGLWLTTNGGAAWQPISSRLFNGGYINVDHLDMADADGEIILSDADARFSDDSAQCFSVDGGETWHGWLPPNSGAELGVQAWRANHDVWYCAGSTGNSYPHGFLFRSTNQGVSWDTLSSIHLESDDSFYQDPLCDSVFYYLSSDSIYGTYARVTRSSDAGATWSSTLHLYSSGVRASHADRMIRMSNGDFIVVVEYDPFSNAPEWSLALIGDSTGENFDVVNGVWDWNHPECVLEDLNSPGTILMGASCAGGLMRSTNYGQSWQAALPVLPAGRQFGTLLYQNPYGGALYVHVDGFGLFRSTDHGASWQPLNMPPLGASGNMTVRSSALYSRAGTLGTVIQWQLEAPFTQWRLLANVDAQEDTFVTFSTVLRKAGDSLLCYALTKRLGFTRPVGGRMAYSEDNGQNWAFGPMLPCTLDVDFFRVFEDNIPPRVYARRYSTCCSLYVSLDWGQNWSALPTSSDLGVPIEIASREDTLYVLTGSTPWSASRILRSTNLGATWETIFSANPLTLPALVMMGSDLFTFNRNELVRWSPGLGWETRGALPVQGNSFPQPGLEGIPGQNPLLLCHSIWGDNHMYVSADSGHSWEARTVELPGWSQLSGVWALKWDPYRRRLWADTHMGLCYTDEYDLSTKGPLVFKPADYTVLSCYPNPFNSTANIRFDLMKRQQAKVELFDLQGRHVQTLVDEVREAGRNEIFFEGSGLASGTYFVRLETPGVKKTVKILLLK